MPTETLEKLCDLCGFAGVNDDGEQEHWGNCPKVKDEYADGDRKHDELTDNAF